MTAGFLSVNDFIAALMAHECVLFCSLFYVYSADMSESLLTIEAWLQGAWTAVATLERLDDGALGCQGATRLTYLQAHVLAHHGERGATALSVCQPVSFVPESLAAWPAVMTDILPQGFGRQRLAAHLGIAARLPASDWALLRAGAGNPIGHLRVREAADELALQPRSDGWTLQSLHERAEDFLESLHAAGFALGGSSGVQGEWPKLLMTEGRDARWHLDHQLPDAAAERHWLVKFSRHDETGVFDDILRAEAIFHDIAATLGARVHGRAIYDRGLLFVPRFDRALSPSGKVERIAQESLYTLTNRGGFDAHVTHNQVCQALVDHASDPETELLEYVWRDVINVALGNRDNHGRNMAIQRFEDGRVALAPVYDLAPMCLHPDGIARRMRWRQDDNARPDWGSVAAQVAESGALAEEALRANYLSWAERLEAVPDLLQQQDCPARVQRAVLPLLREVIAALRRAG